MNTTDDMEILADSVRTGERRAIARAITIIESTREEHRDMADVLLRMLLPDSGNAIRCG